MQVEESLVVAIRNRHTLIDISMSVDVQGLIWPGLPRPTRELWSNLRAGESSTHSVLTLSSHLGTHIDWPSHTRDVETSARQFTLDVFIGLAWVVDARQWERSIPPAALDPIRGVAPERVLFRTSNSDLRLSPPFDEDYVAIATDTARELVDLGVRLVGLDFPGIEPYENLPEVPTHHVFADAEVAVLEGLDLSGVKAGSYHLVALPQNTLDAEASWTRAILIDSEPSFVAEGT